MLGTSACSKSQENGAAASNAGPTAIVLPTEYEEDRFFVVPVTDAGRKARFFTDTGGGLFIFRDSFERIAPGQSVAEGEEGESQTPMPTFREEAWIPPPMGTTGVLPLVPTEMRQKAGEISEGVDGMLGQAWFADRVWTFDYSGKTLVLHTDGTYNRSESARNVGLAFKTADDGARKSHFPRIEVVIDGAAVSLLFDTGATVHLTDDAVAQLADGRPAIRATSFMAANVFDRWRQNHPEWRVIEKAERNSNEAMIEVPIVEVAGFKVGPAWFTRRADANFHQYMSQWMDQRIDGALGGNVLRYFRVTVDYPQAVAVFDKL